jgi:hypothetical protein
VINEGLNVVESWNQANSVIFFGKGGDIATNRPAALRALPARAAGRPGLRQHADGQDVLADHDWAAQLTDADRRGLTPLFWTHVAP